MRSKSEDIYNAVQMCPVLGFFGPEYQQLVDENAVSHQYTGLASKIDLQRSEVGKVELLRIKCEGVLMASIPATLYTFITDHYPHLVNLFLMRGIFLTLAHRSFSTRETLVVLELLLDAMAVCLQRVTAQRHTTGMALLNQHCQVRCPLRHTLQSYQSLSLSPSLRI